MNESVRVIKALLSLLCVCDINKEICKSDNNIAMIAVYVVCYMQYAIVTCVE